MAQADFNKEISSYLENGTVENLNAVLKAVQYALAKLVYGSLNYENKIVGLTECLERMSDSQLASDEFKSELIEATLELASKVKAIPQDKFHERHIDLLYANLKVVINLSANASIIQLDKIVELLKYFFKLELGNHSLVAYDLIKNFAHVVSSRPFQERELGFWNSQMTCFVSNILERGKKIDHAHPITALEWWRDIFNYEQKSYVFRDLFRYLTDRKSWDLPYEEGNAISFNNHLSLFGVYLKNMAPGVVNDVTRSLLNNFIVMIQYKPSFYDAVMGRAEDFITEVCIPKANMRNLREIFRFVVEFHNNTRLISWEFKNSKIFDACVKRANELGFFSRPDLFEKFVNFYASRYRPASDQLIGACASFANENQLDLILSSIVDRLSHPFNSEERHHAAENLKRIFRFIKDPIMYSVWCERIKEIGNYEAQTLAKQLSQQPQAMQNDGRKRIRLN